MTFYIRAMPDNFTGYQINRVFGNVGHEIRNPLQLSRKSVQLKGVGKLQGSLLASFFRFGIDIIFQFIYSPIFSRNVFSLFLLSINA